MSITLESTLLISQYLSEATIFKIFIPYRLALPVLHCHITRIISLCLVHFCKVTVFLRVMQVIVSVSSCLFIAEYSIVLYTTINLCIHLLVSIWNVSSFWIKPAINIIVEFFWGYMFSHFFINYEGMKLVDYRVSICLTLLETAKQVSKVMVQFYIPTSNFEFLFNFSFSSILRFPYNQWCWTSFHVLYWPFVYLILCLFKYFVHLKKLDYVSSYYFVGVFFYILSMNVLYMY